MKIKVLSAAVSIVALSWLGISFATPSDPAADTRLKLYLSESNVDAAHADSHRLGVLLEEEVALPDWSERTSVTELALVVD